MTATALLGTIAAMIADTLCQQVAAPVEAFDIHVRCRAPWQIEWRTASDDGIRRLCVDADKDNIYGDRIDVRYIIGEDSVARRWSLETKNVRDAVSLRVAANAYGTHLYAGDGDEIDGAGDALDVNFAVGSSIVLTRKDDCAPVVARAPIVYRFTPEHYPMKVEQLLAYLSDSEDAVEGLWEFMDSDIGRQGTLVTYPLRLATVKDKSGGYAILYLGGYDNLGDVWHVMDVKGRMTTTPFINDYDLRWYCADGSELSGQINAAIEAGGAILSLHLGVEPTVMRFRRVRQTPR